MSRTVILALSVFLLIACAPAGTGPFGDDPDIVRAPRPLVKETTYTNQELGFSFTIPAGWLLTGGNPESETCSFSHRDKALGFHMSSTTMSEHFPILTSVKASLNEAIGEMAQGTYVMAERLDREGETTGCTGWITMDGIPPESDVESPLRRIIWHCYDQDLHYINFTVSAPAETFTSHSDTLQGILDSITFQ